MERSVGFFNAEGPPVPIPNTEVKLRSAEDTVLATVRENRSKPTPKEPSACSACFGKMVIPSMYGGVAQLGEHLLCKQGVMGSSPIISTKVVGDANQPV